jgi:hypothetical protein
MNADGSQETRLTNTNLNESFPTWSPDGTKILYIKADSQICVLTLSSPNSPTCNLVSLPYGGSLYNPDWSPDGTTILAAESIPPYSSIHKFSPSGIDQGLFIDNATDSAWSPDGSQVAYTSTTGGIWILTIANPTQPHQLTNTNSYSREPVWSSDGSKIVFTSAQTGDAEIYSGPSNGSPSSTWTNLSRDPGWGDSYPDWGNGSTAPGISPNDPVPFDPNRFSQRTLNECTQDFQNDSTSRQYCWVHVSVLHLIDKLNPPTISSLTYQILLEALIEGEYRSSKGYIRQQLPQLEHWPDEALARRFYSVKNGCGLDGCQGDELYKFLLYYQPAVQDLLSNYYLRVKSLKSAQLADLDASVSAVLTPLNSNWKNGVQNTTPYGWGTVFEKDITTDLPNYKLCNEEGFAVTRSHFKNGC